MPAGSMPLMKQLSVAIIDSNPALMSGRSINKEDPQIQGDSSTLKMLALGIMLNNIDMSLVHFLQVSLLKKHEADRKPANVTRMVIVNGFQKAYSVRFGPLNILQAAAFHGAHYISPLKRNIISFASGEQRLPVF
ncbi:unnamed protein product [Ilex paraguariensis]|uniref:Uncharacterized protein n=1 Tax=Ilex paraguariensis TaxID=185542 RepID=A0ABC8R9W0_9AQUA